MIKILKKYIPIIIVFFALNKLINFIPYLYPRISPAAITPYRLWIYALIIFYFILPSKSKF
jgi:threonine/homoserine efflux transporter RhtA